MCLKSIGGKSVVGLRCEVIYILARRNWWRGQDYIGV